MFLNSRGRVLRIIKVYLSTACPLLSRALKFVSKSLAVRCRNERAFVPS
jgi:hypothetical protein